MILGAATGSYPVLAVSHAALAANLQLFRNRSGAEVLLPVKAGAYGIGLDTIFPFLQSVYDPSGRQGIRWLGVANPGEGRQLRQMGWPGRILNLGGFYREDVHLFPDYRITPSVTDLWHFEILQKTAEARSAMMEVHLKWDVGMGRIGLRPDDLSSVIAELNRARNLKVSGLFIHFPSADNGRPEPTGNQLQRFLEISRELKSKCDLQDFLLHAANSAAAIAHPDSSLDMIRPGISFYGYFGDYAQWQEFRDKVPLKPCLRLEARPVSRRRLHRGDTVSYGGTYVVRDEWEDLDVLPLGYADGIPRSLSNRLTIRDRHLRGRVTMDQTMWSVPADTAPGTPVEIAGPSSPPLEWWAELAGTSTYEIISGLGARLQRILVKEFR